jgi:hypothetical protein
MKMAARGEGKLAVCLDSFDAVFQENQANCQFALHCSELAFVHFAMPALAPASQNGQRQRHFSIS